MADKGWKQAERRFAATVGTTRKPCDGSRDGADFDDGVAIYQLKVRRSLPAWLWRWLTGIQETGATTREARVGILVLKLPRQRDEDALVVLSWKDWLTLRGDPREVRHDD